ncbi:MAG: membrane protein insertion efficiency factor YidD [Leptolyngbya sp. PLA3]|nr:MAG: membrane protein insertion efficiency factor YidD [Cyanobacteria bacterium CYA]MCE7967681.1 membrane protein insertion efficiency factor YidD [Leptolyngbya sp. PL-A3]
MCLPFVALIWAYRCTLSPFLGGQCRFHPTCSRYALEAYRMHGPWLGTRLTVRRVLRCHPFNRGGYDPVPVNEPPVGTFPGCGTLDVACPGRESVDRASSEGSIA